MTPAQLAVGFAAVATATRVARGAPCTPEVTLAGGDAQLIERVNAALAKLGDDVTAATVSPRCKRVAATVAIDGDGAIAVGVQHGAQRDDREVGDAVLAAAWIDSWLHDDELAPVEPIAPIAIAPAITTPFEADDSIAVATTTTPTRSAWDTVSLGAAFEQQWTTDGTRWTGGSAAACLRVGAACFGARVRFAEQAIAYAETAAQRDDLAVLATASYEHTVGRLVIAPELGIGVGRDATERLDGCRTPGQTSSPPMCSPPDGAPDALLVGDGFHVASYTPRGEAMLRISIPLFDRVWLDGTAAATIAPFGHSDTYELDPSRMPPPMTTRDQIALPGDELGSFQLGIGLRIGARTP